MSLHYLFTGSGANYKRVIYVKTMEFKSVKILNKTDGLFSTQYSDPVDLLTQCLRFKFDRLEEQVKGIIWLISVVYIPLNQGCIAVNSLNKVYN